MGGNIIKYRPYRHNVVERDGIEGGFHKGSQEHQQWEQIQQILHCQ